MSEERADWIGGLAEWTEGETAYLSVAFTWLLNDAWSRARWYKELGYKVVAGGPGIFTRKHFLADVAEIPMKTVERDGRTIQVLGDLYDNDAVRRHNPDATFASRGCPVGCYFCIVPKMEGKDFTLLPDFHVRPILCDNNLSALPAEFQNHIVARYQATGVPLLDANSGFEPRTFDDEVYARWKPINRGVWRFAYDDQAERGYVESVMKMLKTEPPRKKRVYVLIGNEPVAACVERIQHVLDWGGEPHVQPYMKLNVLEKKLNVRFDWTEKALKETARWANRRIWRYATLAEYRGSAKTSRDHYDARQGLFL